MVTINLTFDAPVETFTEDQINAVLELATETIMADDRSQTVYEDVEGAIKYQVVFG